MRSVVVFLVALLLGTVDPVLAQTAAGGLRGVVTDQTVCALPGTTIDVKDGEGRIVASVIAGADGRYQLDGIAAGRYVVEFRLANFAMLRRNVTIEDVGNVGAFLCSDLAAGVTGEVTYVDCGYSILGMTAIVDP